MLCKKLFFVCDHILKLRIRLVTAVDEHIKIWIQHFLEILIQRLEGEGPEEHSQNEGYDYEKNVRINSRTPTEGIVEAIRNSQTWEPGLEFTPAELLKAISMIMAHYFHR